MACSAKFDRHRLQRNVFKLSQMIPTLIKTPMGRLFIKRISIEAPMFGGMIPMVLSRNALASVGIGVINRYMKVLNNQKLNIALGPKVRLVLVM